MSTFNKPSELSLPFIFIYKEQNSKFKKSYLIYFQNILSITGFEAVFVHTKILQLLDK